MMINWRTGKAGFVGSSKTPISGFFQFSHTVTTEIVLWTVQTPVSTSWADQSADTTIWTDETPDSTTWADQ